MAGCAQDLELAPPPACRLRAIVQRALKSAQCTQETWLPHAGTQVFDDFIFDLKRALDLRRFPNKAIDRLFSEHSEIHPSCNGAWLVRAPAFRALRTLMIASQATVPCDPVMLCAAELITTRPSIACSRSTARSTPAAMAPGWCARLHSGLWVKPDDSMPDNSDL